MEHNASANWIALVLRTDSDDRQDFPASGQQVTNEHKAAGCDADVESAMTEKSLRHSLPDKESASGISGDNEICCENHAELRERYAM